MSTDAIEALRRNFALHITDPLVGMPGTRAGVRPELAIGDSGTDCDTFNIVAGARLSGDVASKVELITATFEGRPFSWWVTTGDTPDDLGEELERAGLRRDETEVAMACPLPSAAPPATDLVLRTVRAVDELAAYADVNHRNWSPPDERVTAFYAGAAARVLRADSPFIYVIGATPDGAVVAAGEGCLSGDVVGLYGISTLAPWRRRGYALAICAAILAEASARGATTAVLQASSDGLGLYRRLGFTEIGHCTEYKPAP